MMDAYFLDVNSNVFAVPDVPDGYERKDASRIAPPPTPSHRWIDGEWRLLDQMPEPPRSYTWLEFMDLFTEAEEVELVGASMTDVSVKRWYDRAVGSQGILMSDPRTQQGLQVLVDANLLSAARRDQVLAGVFQQGG